MAHLDTSPHPPGPLPSVSEELIRALPKTDLHCHVDGSTRIGTILELGEHQKVKLPADTPEGRSRALHQGLICESPEDYLTAFDVTLSVLQTEEVLHRVAYELAIDAASEKVGLLRRRLRDDAVSEVGVRSEDAVVVDTVNAWRRDECGDLGEEFVGREEEEKWL